MPTYHPPNHNRLLDLEHHLQRQQHGTTAPRQPLRQQSAQRQRSYRELFNPLPKAKAECHQEHESQVNPRQQPHSQRSKSPSGRNPSQSNADRAFAAPQHLQSRNSKKSAGSYRQLASEMGKHTYSRTSGEQPMPEDLIEIQTCIKQEVSESDTVSMPATGKQQAMPSPVELSASPATNAAPQPQWKQLAKTIRQARLKINDTEVFVHATGEAVNKVIDEANRRDLKLDGAQAGHSTAPVERANASVDQPSRRILEGRTHRQNENVPGEVIVLPKDQQDTPDDMRGFERSMPATDQHPIRENVTRCILRFYERTCRPQVVKVLAQIQRKKKPKTTTAHGQT